MVSHLYEAIEGVFRVQQQLAQIHVLAAEKGLDFRLPFLKYSHSPECLVSNIRQLD